MPLLDIFTQNADFLGKRNQVLQGLIRSLDKLKELGVKDIDWENLKRAVINLP